MKIRYMIIVSILLICFITQNLLVVSSATFTELDTTNYNETTGEFFEEFTGI